MNRRRDHPHIIEIAMSIDRVSGDALGEATRRRALAPAFTQPASAEFFLALITRSLVQALGSHQKPGHVLIDRCVGCSRRRDMLQRD